MGVFDLEAIIKLTDQGFKTGLRTAGKALSTFGKVAGVAIAAGTTAVAGLVKSSVDAYAEYEQLSGGVQKLFGNMGKDLSAYAKMTGQTMSEARKEWQHLEYAQNTVLRNAEKAFETTGMSANEYIQSVTGVSAFLINSLGGDTVKAAKAADMAMRDIADNANTFGTYTAQELTGVYQALAKGQYQTLDNLQLGYKGSKEGMQDLIAHANELKKANGEMGDLTIESYADIVEAIHLVQNEMNITGTTEREAAKTISGSINMTKAAWKNLVRAFSDKDADLSQYFDALVSSAEIAFDNILPVAQRAVEGIGQVITDIVPKLGEKIPEMVTSVLPGIVQAGTSLVTSLIAGIGEALPILVSSIPQILTGIKDGFVAAWPQLKEAGEKLMEIVGEGIKKAGEKLKDLSKKAFDKVAPIAAEAWDKIKSAAEQRFPGISDLVSRTWEGIKSGTSQAWEGITSEVGNIWTGLQDLWGEHGGQLSDAVGNIWEGVKQRWTAALEFWDTWGGDIMHVFSDFGENYKTIFSTAFSVVSDLFAAFSAAFAGDWSGMWDNLKQAGSDAWQGITNFLSTYWDAIKTLASIAWAGVKSAVSKAWDGVKEAIKASPLAQKATDAWNTVQSEVSGAWEGIKSAVGTAWENVQSAITPSTISDFVGTAWTSIQSNVSGAWEGIKGEVSTAWENLKSSITPSSFSDIIGEAWSSTQAGVSGAWEGIKSAVSEELEGVKGLLNFSWSFPEISLPKLPKISVSWESALGGAITYPKLSWAAKAMQNPYLFSGATIFGAGETGDEVLYGRNALMNDISNAVGARNDSVAAKLDAILALIDEYLPDAAARPVVLDSGALVGGIGYDMDNRLGDYSAMGGRGLSLA